MTGPNVVSGVPPIPSERGPPPLSLYIHIPWCVRKCPYCDFNSHELQGVLPETAYVSAVLRDLEYEAGRIGGREVQTIFIGGGTPSLLSGEAVRCLLSGVRARVKVATPAEVTLESNPGSVDCGRLVDYQEAGVNRLSIGVQSFRARQLAALGRIHSVDDALRAFEAARRAGVSNINLDLMFGLPEDDVEGSLQDLSQAMALGPEHLSWYQLAIEPNTAFYRHPPELPDDDQVFGPTKLAAPCCASAATSSTRSRPTRAPGPNAVTTATTGSSGIIWGSGPGHTASSAISPTGASCAARNARSPCPI
ncbi:MAG: radical SAM family heme chaperone HemW [Gammaproteobacteria bacterium]